MRSIVDARSIERLVLLELSDLEVPPEEGAEVAPLYFRVRAEGASSLRVELWQLGRAYGQRSVSTAGTEQLRTRRIALAAAELARQLRRRRAGERAARAAALDRAREQAERRRFGSPIHARLALFGGGRSSLLGTAGSWAAGPVLGTAVSFDTGQRVTLDAAWLAGNVRDPGSSVRWFEVGLAMLQEFELSSAVSLAVGGQAAAASVQLGRVGERSTGDLHTWSARAGGLARVEFLLSRAIALGVGPEAGVLLHPVVGRGKNGEVAELRGAWLGAGLVLSTVIDP